MAALVDVWGSSHHLFETAASWVMADAYHELTNVEDIDEDALAIPRARAVLAAIHAQRDFTLVRALRHVADGDLALECLIVDVECDGVPHKNTLGIQYRERLALCIPADATKLPEVLALRQDFPITIHQNQGVLGAPASLCLYFEKAISVLRTWTPAGFLRRIQWWIEKTARGELHPADQPVEHLFFASRYELVLPWNLAELRKDESRGFHIVCRSERSEGSTYFLEPAAQNGARDRTLAHIELTLPPIVHGFVERDPRTLGDLADILSRRQVDLISPLRSVLQDRVPSDGVLASADDGGTAILMHIPLRRTADGEIDGVTHRAFIVPTGALALGAACGALMLHNKRYFRDVMNPAIPVAWRDLPIQPMDVLKQNDAAAARRQSGITSEGPIAVLVGAGALGSALSILWGRSGWGRWTVIDNDHVKPHNLSRHVALVQSIGDPKAEVVAGLHQATMAGATKITPVAVDATNFAHEELKRALDGASLVVDASTTLEYPRTASTRDALPRHISVFITPDGNGSVLLAEDAARGLRLRTLEAQYYRALIQTKAGDKHIRAEASTFWSGASCRDLSFVMPYSRILAHASTLAEQVVAASSIDEAAIRIWRRDPASGVVSVHDVRAHAERRFAVGEFRVYVDNGAVSQLRKLRKQGLPNETGGALLGYYDFNVMSVVVVAGLPAPADSKASPDSFERGIAGLAKAVNDASARTAGMVGYIGEWHSHPPGHSSAPSGQDFVQLIRLALGMADDGLPAIQLIVAEHEIDVLHGHVA